MKTLTVLLFLAMQMTQTADAKAVSEITKSWHECGKDRKLIQVTEVYDSKGKKLLSSDTKQVMINNKPVKCN